MVTKPKGRDKVHKVKDPVEEVLEDLTRRVGACERMIRELNKRSVAVEQAMTLLRQQTPRTPPPGVGPPVPQSPYMSGQFKRRDGTVYGDVALPGSPNEGDNGETTDHPTGPVPPAVERGSGHEGTGEVPHRPVAEPEDGDRRGGEGSE
jgi:hypothetical protein